MFQRITNYAARLETARTPIPNGKIAAMISESIGQGYFGDMRPFFPSSLSNAHGHSSTIGDPSLQFYQHGYQTYSNHLPYLQHVNSSPLYALAGTIDPSMMFVHAPYGNYEGDSDSTHPEVDFEPSYGYVSNLSVLHDLTAQGTSVAGQTQMAYSFRV